MPKKLPRWRLVENVVAAIERVVGQGGGWQVTQNAMVARRHASARRQVDVFAECPSGSRTFRVGIDVKDEKAPLDIETVEQLCAKGRSLALDRYVIVSTSGFTTPGRQEAERQGVEAMRLRGAEFAKFFALNHVEWSVPTIHQVIVLFAENAHHPPLAPTSEGWIELAEVCTRLGVVAAHYVDQEFRAHPEWTDGQIRSLRIADRDGNWKRFAVGGQSWDPPAAMDVFWSAKTDRVAGHKFTTESGSEAFTAVLPVSGGMRQVTLVAGHQQGGVRVAMSISDPSPQRTDV